MVGPGCSFQPVEVQAHPQLWRHRPKDPTIGKNLAREIQVQLHEESGQRYSTVKKAPVWADKFLRWWHSRRVRSCLKQLECELLKVLVQAQSHRHIKRLSFLQRHYFHHPLLQVSSHRLSHHLHPTRTHHHPHSFHFCPRTRFQWQNRKHRHFDDCLCWTNACH